MKKFDFRMFLIALLALFMSMGNGMTAWAEGHPSLSELIGRYRLSGECAVEGDNLIPATTDYNIAILPGAEDGTVQLNGWFGYGGGFAGTYDETTGVLSCSIPAAYLCATVDAFWTSGVMAIIDPGQGNTADLKFSVSRTEGGLVLSTDGSLIVQASRLSDMMQEGASAGYLNGFTLTKETVNRPLSELSGTYAFKASSEMISNTVQDASDEFEMTVSVSGDNKVTISGLFGIPSCVVEATYYEESGIVVFPHDVRFTDKLFMGDDMDNGIMAFESAPYFYVNGTEWVSPSSFILNGGMEMDMDYEMEMPLVCSFVGGKAVKAESHPSLSELIGRYRLSGECTVEGDDLIPAATDYNIAILPGAEDGTVQLNGWFGYGGGFAGTYDETTGVLSCSIPAAYLCATVDAFWTSGVMAIIDPGQGNTADLKFSVSRTEGGLVLSTDGSLIVQASRLSDMMQEGASAGYLNGFTLTKETVNRPLSELSGTYAFKASSEMISNTVQDASDEFEMTVSVSGDNKVTISGLFGIPSCVVEATYYEESGIVVFPHDVRFTDKLFMGDDMDNGIMAFESAPYFYVNGTEWVSPSSFILNGGMEMDMDYEMEMPLVCSFVGGKAVKQNADAIQTVGTDNGIRIAAANNTITVTSPVVETLNVYDVQGRVVASATGTKMTVDSLPTGLYIVKAGKDTRKIMLR